MESPSRTVIGKDFGRGLDSLKGSEVDELVHARAVRLNLGSVSWICISGEVALDEDYQVMAPYDIRSQTRIILERLDALLAEQGGTIADIVRVRVYIVDLDDESFQAVHEERAKWFTRDTYPASTLVEVAGLIKPELRIEIDADAVLM